MNTPKFYVGQKVVAIVDHSLSVFKKGDEFIVTGVYPPCCACGHYGITIGILHTSKLRRCIRCFTVTNTVSKEWTFSENGFEAVIEKFQAITFEKIIEEQLTSVN